MLSKYILIVYLYHPLPTTEQPDLGLDNNDVVEKTLKKLGLNSLMIHILGLIIQSLGENDGNLPIIVLGTDVL